MKSKNRIRIYLDNCCFNRPFDDQTQLLISIESIAKLYIQSRILVDNYELVWSDILEYENSKNPFDERSKRISEWKKVAVLVVKSDNNVIEKAKEIMKSGVKTKDALHIASAMQADVDYFITTDKGILKKTKTIKELSIINPIDFVKEVENENEN